MSEGIHFGPTEGVKVSYSKKDILDELGEICDFEVPEQRNNFGSVPQDNLQKIAAFLGLETHGCKRDILDRLGEFCGFENDGWHNCLNKDKLWKIFQDVKEEEAQ